MALCNSIASLRCSLCRNRLLGEYEVYSRETDRFGMPSPPQLYAFTCGYFYAGSTRHYSEILEIAVDIRGKTAHGFRLLQFDDNASLGDLILIGGTFYRVSFIREIYSSCRLLDLEAETVENPD